MSADTRPLSEPESDENSVDHSELRAEVEILREENTQLREAYAHSRRTNYRRTAMGLFAVGSIAIGGAALFPAVRQILLALGSIGIFGSLLTYYLTPEKFVAATVGEQIYTAFAQTTENLTSELGLAQTQIYVPTDGPIPARLFVPQREDDDLPEPDELTNVLVVGTNETRGVSLLPTGSYLFREFEQTLTEPFGDTPERAIQQLTDAVVEDFELARNIEIDSDRDATPSRITARISGSSFEQSERLDNPIASLLGVGLAVAVETAVTVDTVSDGDELLVTLQWQ